MNKGFLFVLISAAGYGSASIFAKLAFSEGLDTFTLLTIRYTIAALIMWTYLGVTHQIRPVGKMDGLLLVIASLTGNILIPILYFQGLQLLPISLFVILSYTYPAFVAVMAVVFLKETLGRNKGTALLLTLVGCTIMYWTPGLTYSIPGVALALSASFSYSIYILGIARYLRHIPPALAMTSTISFAALMFLAYGLIANRIIPPTPTGWILLAGLALFSTAISSITFFSGIQLIGPSRAALVSTIEPVFTIVLAQIVFQELVSTQQAIGGLLVIIAIVVLQLANFRSPAPPVK
jgi:drug/metabolite transporter (DMT)-like permease